MGKPGQKPNLCTPGKIDRDCMEIKEKQELKKNRIQENRLARVKIDQIQGVPAQETAKKLGVTPETISHYRRKTRLEKYRDKRERDVKKVVKGISEQHANIIQGKFSDSGRARTVLEGIKHADKLMGLGQDQGTQPQGTGDKVAGIKAELAGLVLMFIKPEHKEQAQEIECEVIQDTGDKGQGVG